ncbi:MAG: NAD-dependent epimerase/dehydratase family protein [Pseudomonadota bacterium]
MTGKLLITGGCGFVGANLIAGAIRQGASHIRVLDNESGGDRAWISEFDVEFQRGDIRDPEAAATAVKGMDCVIHLAADTRVMDSIENPSFNFDVNVAGTLNILEAMRQQGVERIVNASTGGAIIGDATPPVNEDMPARPASPYGAAKLAVEGYCSAYSAAYGLKATSLRFSNVYGPRSYHKGSVVALFCRQILNGEMLVVYGDGSQTRDYVYVEDLVDGIISAIRTDETGVFQLGTGTGTSLNELIDIMREIAGPERKIDVDYADFRSGEIRHTWCDISKARDVLGYMPKISLLDGIKNTWDWFEAR